MLPRASTGIIQGMIYFFSYLAWTWVVRLLAFTLITFFLQSGGAKFQDVSDVYASSEILIYGLSAILFVLFLKLLNPLTSTTLEEIFSPHRIEKMFFPWLFWGSILGLSLVLGFIFQGVYHYLGNPIPWGETPSMASNVALRMISLVVLVYFEEFIFRHKILNSLRSYFGDFRAIGINSFMFCAVKAIQFDLGWMHLLTLYLFSIGAGLRLLNAGDFTRSAGFFVGLLLVFHPLLSLPVFGSEFQGILLLRYQVDQPSFLIYLLTGGVGGPLSSGVLQCALLMVIFKIIYDNKKARR